MIILITAVQNKYSAQDSQKFFFVGNDISVAMAKFYKRFESGMIYEVSTIFAEEIK